MKELVSFLNSICDGRIDSESGIGIRKTDAKKIYVAKNVRLIYVEWSG